MAHQGHEVSLLTLSHLSRSCGTKQGYSSPSLELAMVAICGALRGALIPPIVLLSTLLPSPLFCPICTAGLGGGWRLCVARHVLPRGWSLPTEECYTLPMPTTNLDQ
jgi:hypothetical protein